MEVQLVDSEGNELEDILVGYPSILTLEQLTEVLQISKNNARIKLQTGEIRAMKVGRLWRIPKAWLIEAINSGKSL
ncbi:MAG: helix-turn-helix domain-containing protein [Coriobacteriia bacterium]|nr:helix-turn-helix domain-containing protein [Coriobacteriia bacterium]